MAKIIGLILLGIISLAGVGVGIYYIINTVNLFF